MMINNIQYLLNFNDNLDWRNIEFSFPQRTIRLGTSFSGIGAIEHALKRLGLKTQIQFAGDIDKDCKTAYFENYEITEDKWHYDIKNFDAKQYYNKIDLFVGGAPCQAFSLRGKRGGFEDTRGTLFREFARIIIETKPKVFIFENVKGIINHDKGNTWRIIKETFENDCGYKVYYKILNGRDFGIPQNRERLFCIGFKENIDFSYPAPIPLNKKVFDFLEEKINIKYFFKTKGVRFITEHINHKKQYTQINGDILLCQKRNQQFNWHGDFIFHPCLKTDIKSFGTDVYLHRLSDYEEEYFKDNTNGKYAIVPIDKDNYLMKTYSDSEINKSFGRFRKFTPRECIRLMGFDDSFKIVVPDTATYKQAGNSIIVDVLMALLKQMDITRFGIDL